MYVTPPLKEFPWNWRLALGIKNWTDAATGPRKKFGDIQPSAYNTRT